MNQQKYHKLLFAVAILACLTGIFLLKKQCMPIQAGRIQAEADHNVRSPLRNSLVESRLQLLSDMRRSDPNYMLKVPLEFYGKVLDQRDQPVAGAKIEIRLNVPDDNAVRSRSLTSNGEGSFSLSGLNGQRVYVEVFSPLGYTCGESGDSGSYNYADPEAFNFHVPDPNRPLVFRLWRYEHAEPMYRWRLEDRHLDDEGTVRWFDLENIKGSSQHLGASITNHLAVNTDEIRITYKLQAGDNCDILETNDSPMFTPPATGYRKEIVHEYHLKKGEIVSNAAQEFRCYFRVAGGYYSGIVATFSPGFTGRSPYDGKILLTVYKNPSGALNLEYDERLRIPDRR